METLRVGDPARQGGRHRGHHRAGAAREDPELVRAGRGEGARLWQPVVELPDGGLFLSADALHRRGAAATIAQVEIFGPGRGADDVPHARRKRSSWPTTPATASRPASGPRTSTSRWTSRRKAQGRLGLDQLHQRVRRGRRVRRVSRERVRAGGGQEGLWEYVKEGSDRRGERRSRGRLARRARRRPCGDSSPRPRSLRRSHRRSTAPPSSTSAASRCGPIPGTACRCTTPEARSAGRGRARQPEGHPQRGRGGARRPSGGRRATAHLRAQVLYYVAENLAARREEFAARIATLTGRSKQQAGKRWTLSLRGCSATPPGPTSTTAGAPHARSATSRSPCRSRSACMARGLSRRVAAARIPVGRCCRRSRWGTRSWRLPSGRWPLAGHRSLPGVRHLATCRAAC